MSRVQAPALWSCVVAVVSSLALGAQAPAPLSPKLIADAIELGTYGEPAPYRLRHAGGRTPNPVVVGAIYTPYQRVALAARTARMAGRTFTEADVTALLIEPVFYVAFRWYCCGAEQDKDTFNPLVLSDYKIALVPARGLSPLAPQNLQEATQPVWIRRDVSLLDPFGGVPYDDVVLVAAYPMEALTADRHFVIHRQMDVRFGRILASELASWR